MDETARSTGEDGTRASGGMVGRIAAHDWSATPLGPPERWPMPLRTLLSVMLGSKQPMFVAWGAEGTLVYNDAYGEILVGKHPAALGRPFLDVWHEIRSDLLPIVERAYHGKPVQMDDITLTLERRGFPEETHFAFSYTPVRDEGGAVAGFFCACQEITAQVLAERRLRRDEARLRFLGTLDEALRDARDAQDAMRAATELLARHVGASRCAYADVDADNDRFAIRSDYTVPGLDSSAGTYSLGLFGSRAVADMRGGRTLVVRDVPAELAPEDGGAMFLAIGIRGVVCCPLLKDGHLVAMMAVHQADPRDWTPDEIDLVETVVERCWTHVQRVGAERRLRESEERLRALTETLAQQVEERTAERDRMWDTSPDLLLVLDGNGVFRRVNPSWTAILGFAPEELIGMRVERLVLPDDVDLTEQALALAREKPLPVVENRCRHKDGSFRWISWVAAPQAGLIYATGRDVTAEKARQAELNAAQDQLRQSQKMEAMGQLTGGVAHDFNNLLTPIVSSLDMLLRRGVGTERERRLMDGALQSAERAKVLVQRLLAFARRQPLKTGPVDLARLVDGMAGLVASTVGPRIEVAMEVAPDLPPAIADANQLEMALLNLVVNARDAMPDTGRLVIAADPQSVRGPHPASLRPGDYVRISVRDSGAGMDDETRARAVEPFFSTKGVGKGTGLGLSMVHGLASQLNGGLSIESQPGQGSTVTLWLPISVGEAAQDGGGVVEAREFKGPRGTALLVDDEDIVRMSASAMLADLGYDVVEARSAEEALRLIADGTRPDLLVTDHLMPGMSGMDLAGEVRRDRPDLPVLIVSGYAEMDGIAVELPRLAKPFRHAELAASLASLSRFGAA